MKLLKTVYLFVLQRLKAVFATIFKKWQKWSRISRKTLSKNAHFSIFGGIPEIEFLRYSQQGC